MSHKSAAPGADGPISYLKELSGRRIEEARKRAGLTQVQLAQDLGMGTRWLREIESGNPKSRLEDHLRCAYALGLATGHILIPLIFYSHEICYPSQLIFGDLRDLERLCIETVADYNERLVRQITPSWRRTTANAA